MIIVHHLNQSRSQRILWMLEELSLPWEQVSYQREPTMQAPAALKKIHPLGKSPVIEDNGHVIAESGAILEYLQETYDTQNRLKPDDGEGKLQYRYWLHYAEGSLMPLLVMKLIFGSLGKAPVPWLFRPLGKALGQGVQKSYLNGQIATHADFLEQHLSQNTWFAGAQFSVADIQMSYPVAALLSRSGEGSLPHLAAWWDSARQRPAWQKAERISGPFTLPGA